MSILTPYNNLRGTNLLGSNVRIEHEVLSYWESSYDLHVSSMKVKQTTRGKTERCPRPGKILTIKSDSFFNNLQVAKLTTRVAFVK